MCRASILPTTVTHSPGHSAAEQRDAIWESYPWDCRVDLSHHVCVSSETRVFRVALRTYPK